MREKGESTSSSGISFMGLLTIAFVVLKLTGVIAWSWWWVLAPIMISIVILIIILVIILVIIFAIQVAALLDHYAASWKKPHVSYMKDEDYFVSLFLGI